MLGQPRVFDLVHVLAQARGLGGMFGAGVEAAIDDVHALCPPPGFGAGHAWDAGFAGRGVAKCLAQQALARALVFLLRQLGVGGQRLLAGAAQLLRLMLGQRVAQHAGKCVTQAHAAPKLRSAQNCAELPRRRWLASPARPTGRGPNRSGRAACAARALVP